MKKITAVLLTVALLIGTCGFALNASALQFPKISDKINEYNECFSNSASDGLILATVYYNNVVPMPEDEKEIIVYERCGISAGELKVYSDNYRNLTDEEKQIYQEKGNARSTAYWNLISELADQNAAPFLDQMGITLQYNSKNVPIYNNRRVNKNECSMDICLTKNEVLQAAELDYAEGIICNRRVSKNQYRTILFENRLNWENVYVFGYDWSSNKIFGEFPGKLVEEKITDEYGDEYYAIELPRNTKDISLSNGAGEKTESIFYNEIVWADYYAYYLDETEKYDSGDYKLLGFNKCESMDDPDTPGDGNFVLRDNHCWKEAYIYATDKDGNELYGEFPGKQAKRFLDYGGYQFQITVPEGAASIVVSNANGEKTVPITYLDPYWGYSLGSKNKAGDYEVNDFYGYLPEPGADEDEWLDPDYEDPTEEPAVESKNLYEEEYKNWAKANVGERCLEDGYEYKELYYHENGGETDWVLVKAELWLPSPSVVTWIIPDRIGDRVVYSGSLQAGFICGYGIYDVKKNEFYDIADLSAEDSIYEDVQSALEQLKIGYVFGDVNQDGVADVLDATAIKKFTVDKITLNNVSHEICDVNKDNFIDILDAAAIQKAAVQ